MKKWFLASFALLFTLLLSVFSSAYAGTSHDEGWTDTVAAMMGKSPLASNDTIAPALLASSAYYVHVQSIEYAGAFASPQLKAMARTAFLPVLIGIALPPTQGWTGLKRDPSWDAYALLLKGTPIPANSPVLALRPNYDSRAVVCKDGSRQCRGTPS